MKSAEKRLRKRQPRVYARIKDGTWAVQGVTGGGHIWLVHKESGRRVTASGSPSCHHAEMNLVKIMERFERGDYRR